MRKRLTPTENLYETPTEFLEAVEQWSENASVNILQLIWCGCDKLNSEFGEVDLKEEKIGIERSLTQRLEPIISNCCMNGYEPFFIQHESPEEHTMKSARSKPPSYDLAFVLRENPRSKWPIETKVLESENDVSEYIKDVKENYATGKYAPFSSEGAMLGYLLKGDEISSMENIESKLHSNLFDHKVFPGRCHKVSKHTRDSPHTDINLTCNHMIQGLG